MICWRCKCKHDRVAELDQLLLGDGGRGGRGRANELVECGIIPFFALSISIDPSRSRGATNGSRGGTRDWSSASAGEVSYATPFNITPTARAFECTILVSISHHLVPRADSFPGPGRGGGGGGRSSAGRVQRLTGVGSYVTMVGPIPRSVR